MASSSSTIRTVCGAGTRPSLPGAAPRRSRPAASSAVSSTGDHAPGGTVVTGALLGDRYRLDQLIGRGGMAAVWSATDTLLGRPVAIKRLHAGLLADEEHAERFRREAVLVARLSHPNLVHLLDRGEDADGPYLVMELVEGENLKSRIRREGALDPEEAARICGQVGAGARVRARAGRRPPRHQGPERAAHAPDGEVQAGRLRHRAADGGRRRRGAHPHRHAARQRRLPLARAGRRTPGRRAHRRLLARHRALRVPHRRPALQRRGLRRGRDEALLRRRCPIRARRGPTVPDWIAACAMRAAAKDPAAPLPGRRPDGRRARGPRPRHRW